MQTIVVESPAKARTLAGYLGKGYRVVASFGHVRDLPSKPGSVLPEDDFAMIWGADAKAQQRLRAIADALRDSERLILATDPDREGEGIAWHLCEALRARYKIRETTQIARVAFNAVTKSAILAAMKRPRAINMALVDAYRARRALDYLVGFGLSPVLWRKLPGAKSAGRVQSVALRLVVEREAEIEAFRTREYWTIRAQAIGEAKTPFEMRLTHLDGKKLGKFTIGDEKAAKAAVDAVSRGIWRVSAVEAAPHTRNPSPPFITSTLQQEASRKLAMSATQTMRLAQKLYEGVPLDGETVGLITYMRTDGVDMAAEAVSQARAVIGARFGADYVPKSPRGYKSKVKNAQEAHECIRPTDMSRHPESLRALSEDARKLYTLIWQRAIASQMASARLERTTVTAQDEKGAYQWRATGQVMQFDGFLRLYSEGTDDGKDEEQRSLPPLRKGETLLLNDIAAERSVTQPPPRYSEASLVRRLEELGIGRPSTYATILSVLQERGYVRMEKRRLAPEETGWLLTAFLGNYFARYVEYDFTANLEKRLDEISSGALGWKSVMTDFWTDFHATVEKTGALNASDIMAAVDDALESHVFPAREDGADSRACPDCAEGRLHLKRGRYGAFIGCSNYPDCRHARPLIVSADAREAHAAGISEAVLGKDPDGHDVLVKNGRFGPYVELSDPDADKPRRVSIPKDVAPDTLDCALALALLALPRAIGKHPEDGEVIQAGIGRFGPYVRHGRVYATLASSLEALSVGLNRAIALLSEKAASGGRGKQPARPPLKELPPHPEDDAPVRVLEGRYGPYVKWGKVNASIPAGTDPMSITHEQALALLSERVKKKGTKRRNRPKGN